MLNVVVISTAARGGVKAVVDSYCNVGFYSKSNYIFIKSHDDISFWSRIALFFISLFIFFKKLILLKVGIVHIHMSSYGSFFRKSFYVLLANLFSVPVIIHLHGGGFKRFYDMSFVIRFFVHKIFNMSKCIVVLSEYWERVVSDMTSSRVEIVKNFIPDVSCTNECSVNRDQFSILFLGALVKNKGIFDLLEALVVVKKSFPSVVLHCAGCGDMGVIAAVVKKLGLEGCVVVHGWVDGVRKLDLMCRCSLFVLPSYREGMPMSIIEAMSYGMPILSTRVGSIPELVDEKNGVLIDPGDHQMLVDRLILMLAQTEDEVECMGLESRRRYEESFLPELSLSKMRELYLSFGVEP